MRKHIDVAASDISADGVCVFYANVWISYSASGALRRVGVSVERD